MYQFDNRLYFSKENLMKRYSIKNRDVLFRAVYQRRLPECDTIFCGEAYWEVCTIFDWEEKHGGFWEFKKFLERPNDEMSIIRKFPKPQHVSTKEVKTLKKMIKRLTAKMAIFEESLKK